LREKFWILRGRKTIRSVINKCLKCKRYQAKNARVQETCLPEDRVRSASVFEVVGIDLAGPLFLKDGQKVWIVLFTCAVYRAVHLELVCTLSTAGFMSALGRFIARRGRPEIIYSDNGLNFVGADNLFKKINWEKISVDCSIQRIRWKFIPPSAAWWGGWWERLIRMIKNLLRRTLDRTCLDYEQLLTVLCDCEAVLNSRPLTYVSDDVEDLIPLTPAMFLQERQQVGVPDIDELDRRCFTKDYRRVQFVKQQLRERFRQGFSQDFLSGGV
jgi:hypothetical protein